MTFEQFVLITGLLAALGMLLIIVAIGYAVVKGWK